MCSLTTGKVFFSTVLSYKLKMNKHLRCTEQLTEATTCIDFYQEKDYQHRLPSM